MANFIPPTAGQVKFIADLIAQVYDGDEATTYWDKVDRMLATDRISRTRASQMIDNLKALRSQKPVTAKAQEHSGIDISQLGGYYAIHDDRTDKLRFFAVDHGERQWEGWVFVREILGPEEVTVGKQAPEEGYRGKYQALMQGILAEPEAAMALYGQKIGRCGLCGLRLTTELSRERGIGPECWKKLTG